MITAKEARQLTATPEQNIETLIRDAASKSQTSLYLKELSEELVNSLKDNGFEVTELPDFAGMKEVIIKW